MGFEGLLVRDSPELCCAVSLSKTLYLVQPRKTYLHDWKIVDWDVKHQHKQTDGLVCLSSFSYFYELVKSTTIHTSEHSKYAQARRI